MGHVRAQAAVTDVATLSSNVLHLFQEALPDPTDRVLFDRLMYEARSRGLSWMEALAYTAERRCGGQSDAGGRHA